MKFKSDLQQWGGKDAEDGLLPKKIEEYRVQGERWLNRRPAAAAFEGEFSQVTTSYAGKGVVRYTL
jgi:hypothetical protein